MDAFGKPLSGGEPIEQREELLAFGRPQTADAPADNPRWPTLQRRATTLFAINLLLLLSAVWAMEFKPSL